ncbi:hypothetical protein Emtol_3197 [Emticicia oligotrophica DSM 17448]|uniref:Toprim domain-containing protein n=1 Tax=Emticicia oligotrophica (strain DSM 17448 / CIP 109782 / MTCC 6937 / GPTSA100-15) TaxID=929562 RepID=A0ABM5N4G2_EMTOG|nr:DUF6371 domain-containing protein [Emticicia oligotrophica]AFK04326.1 hypothetical protein Emtol_3197 [Emticicia oligotrophica DSM 17448]
MSEYPFRFEKSPKKKGTCPACKQSQKFRYYEDLNGQRIGEQFGKCDRENSCGYHHKPKLSDITSESVINVKSEKSIIYPDKTWLQNFDLWLSNSSSYFHQYCMTLGISIEHLKKHSVATDQNGKTVFIFINNENRVVNAKWMLYDIAGHRIKDTKGYSMKQPADDKYKYKMCLYGEDLLDSTKQNTVVIVESEKTKVIASYFYPEFDWVACSSSSGLTDEKISVLFGRKIIWLCDADKAGRSNSSIKKLQSYQLDFEIIDLFPEQEDGYDIADAIGNELKPSILSGKRITIDKKTEGQFSEIVIKNNTAQYKIDHTIWVKGRYNWEVIADNFHIFIKYFTKDENEQNTWILELKIKNRDSIFIEVPHEDFCSAKRLKTILAAKHLSFRANDNHVTELHALLFNKTQFGTATKINRFGYHRDSGVYFFSNKVITTKGKVLEPDEFRIVQSGEFYLSMPTTNAKMQHRFQITDSDVSFNEWYRIYAKTHTLEKAFIPACFYIMSLFRDIVVNHKGSSPILYLKGSAGTGKSSIIRSLTCLFGFQQDDINLKSKNTEAALVKLMSQAANSLLWMDEFYNDFPHEGLLQAAYDNAGYHKSPDSSKSNAETDSIEIHSALALTSNFIPSNHIFFSRCLLIQVESKEKDKYQKEGFQELKDLERGGLACVTVEILRHRKLIQENYPSAFKVLSKRIESAFKNEVIPERLFSNMVQTMTCAYILCSKGLISIGESINEADILDEFAEMAVIYIRKQYQIQDETSILNEFFSTLQILFEDYKLHEGIHFRFDGDLLLLRLPSIYLIFKQRYRSIYFRDSSDKDSIIQEILKLESPREIREIIKTIRFREENDGNVNTMKNAVTNSLSITYSIYSTKFGLDFTNRMAKS